MTDVGRQQYNRGQIADVMSMVEIEIVPGIRSFQKIFVTVRINKALLRH